MWMENIWNELAQRYPTCKEKQTNTQTLKLKSSKEGQSYSTVGKELVLHAADQGSIPCVRYDPPNTATSKSWIWPQNKTKQNKGTRIGE